MMNIIAQSQTGTGKTTSCVLAALSRVVTSKNHVQVLFLSPTQELAVQNCKVAAKMAQHRKDIHLRLAVRGEKVKRNCMLTEHIVFGTILDWGCKFKVFDVKKISVFVLDEADVMIATEGHQDYCIKIHRQLSKNCQMLFFSATYDQEVMAL